MKTIRHYEPLEIEFVKFEDKSVLVVSGNDHDGEWCEDWGGDTL